MGILLLLTATIPVLLHLFLGKGLSLTFHFTVIDYCRNEFYFYGIYRCLNVGYSVNLKKTPQRKLFRVFGTKDPLIKIALDCGVAFVI